MTDFGPVRESTAAGSIAETRPGLTPGAFPPGPGRAIRRAARLIAIGALALPAAGLSCAGPVLKGDPGGQRGDRVVIARVDAADAVVQDLPEDACRHESLPAKPGQKVLVGPSTLPPSLAGVVSDSSRRVEVLVRFCEPFGPELWSRILSGPRAPGGRPGARAGLAARLMALRDSAYDADSARLARDYGATVRERYWLLQGMRIEIPAFALTRLLADPAVVSIQPRYTGTGPPQTTNFDLEDGRALIGSDHYRALGLAGPRLVLLDTGVMATHRLLRLPGQIETRGDCVNGDETCRGSGATSVDDLCPDGHGTYSASVLAGNGCMGLPHRGLTRYPLSSFQVYAPGGSDACPVHSDDNAVVRGLQRSVEEGHRVIVAVVQSGSGPDDVVAAAADHAFLAGAVVVAANGNSSEVTCVAAPACARCALGVGAADVRAPSSVTGHCQGPTGDGRIKPDVVAPTYLKAASALGDEDLIQIGGTSGATPVAGGAAALLYAWLARKAGAIDPGQVYAQMILSGRLDEDPPANQWGAGRLELPQDGICWFGKVTLTRDRNVCEIPLQIPFAFADRPTLTTQLDAALWWPEFSGCVGRPWLGGHSDVDLRLLDAAGKTLAASTLTGSVFERARTRPVSAGPWVLRIEGVSLEGSRQTVYWTALMR
jgi:hypothetical protein